MDLAILEINNKTFTLVVILSSNTFLLRGRVNYSLPG